MFIKVWLTLFKHGNNLYEYQKYTNESNKFIYQFTDKLNLKTPNNKNIGLINLSIYYTWKNIKKEYSNNKFKILAPT